MSENSYNAESIDILEGLEAVRKRPGMYIGSTGPKGLHHMAQEIIDNAIDEALIGECTRIEVIINKDGSLTVIDNGRGIPVDIHPKAKIPAERVIFTVLHAGGKFGHKNYAFSGGLHGVGASVVNALSKWLDVEVYKNGKVYRDRFENGGKPAMALINGELPVVGKTDKHGTKVTFFPDDTIMEAIEFKPEFFKKKLKELAYLNKGLLLVFKDEINAEEIEYIEKEGIVGLVRELNEAKESIHDDVICITGKSANIEVEIAIQYTNEFSETILSYCNNINTSEDGTHVTGFKTAMTRVINQYAREMSFLKEKDANFDGKDVRNGITAIVLIKHPEPQYEGQTKTKLGNTDAESAVREVVNTQIQQYFDRNVEVLKSIIGNAIKSVNLRKAEDNARKNFYSKTDIMGVNSKLAACKSKDPNITEIYIVEGDSAAGSAKMGRERNYQAILPLWGKSLNVEKTTVDKVYSNDKLIPLIISLGTGIGDDFDIKKLKYGKIILLADADVDGAHIRTLLLTFFFRYMPSLITEGHIYVGMPPLYKVSKKKATTPVIDRGEKAKKNDKGVKAEYCYSDKELTLISKKEGNNVANIQRYKGLGEMNPEQLWETTMDPKTRFLRKIAIEDAIRADEITSILMGDKVAPRRDFIYAEAINAKADF